MDDNDTKTAMDNSVLHAYERYDDRYRYLTKLVLDRFNYFIVSSSFLVGAFATTAGKSGLLPVTLVLSLIGIIISITFALINYVNMGYSTLVGSKRQSVLNAVAGADTLKIYSKIEAELIAEDKIDKRLALLPKTFGGLFGILSAAVWPWSKPSFPARLQEFNASNYFAYTWLMPLFATMLWIVPMFALAFGDVRCDVNSGHQTEV